MGQPETAQPEVKETPSYPKKNCEDCGKELAPAQIGGDDSVWDGPRYSGYWPCDCKEKENGCEE